MIERSDGDEVLVQGDDVVLTDAASPPVRSDRGGKTGKGFEWAKTVSGQVEQMTVMLEEADHPALARQMRRLKQEVRDLERETEENRVVTLREAAEAVRRGESTLRRFLAEGTISCLTGGNGTNEKLTFDLRTLKEELGNR